MNRISDFQFFRVRSVSDGHGGGKVFHRLECPDWVNVLAFTRSGEVVFVRQYRFGSDEMTYEFPGGILDSGMSLQDCAESELAEEAGRVSSTWHYAGKARPNAALQNNYAHTFVCFDADEYVFGGHEVEEQIDVCLVDLKDAKWFFQKYLIGQSLMVTAVVLAAAMPLGSVSPPHQLRLSRFIRSCLG